MAAEWMADVVLVVWINKVGNGDVSNCTSDYFRSETTATIL